MIALASPRTRSEFSSPERNHVETEEDDNIGGGSPTPSRRKRVELDKDVDGLGVHG
jgi:hypothetical protein